VEQRRDQRDQSASARNDMMETESLTFAPSLL
jgi:hypothetical protein